MAATAFVGNGTNGTTEDLRFCVKLFVGPLIWAVFSVPCACVGAPASVWLLWKLIQRQRSDSSNNVYMLNLTIIDLLYSLFKLVSILNFFLWRDSQYFMFSFFFDGLNFYGRPLLIACTCVDCYMAVVHPIRYMKISQSRYRIVVCALVWVLTLVLCLLLTFIEHSGSPWSIPCLLAISIITYCDIVILHSLRKPDASGRRDVHPQKQRALQTIAKSFTMTLVSYLPTVLVLFHSGFFTPDGYCYIYIPSSIFPMLGSTILPLLHLSNQGHFNDLRRCVCI